MIKVKLYDWPKQSLIFFSLSENILYTIRSSFWPIAYVENHFFGNNSGVFSSLLIYADQNPIFVTFQSKNPFTSMITEGRAIYTLLSSKFSIILSIFAPLVFVSVHYLTVIIISVRIIVIIITIIDKYFLAELKFYVHRVGIGIGYSMCTDQLQQSRWRRDRIACHFVL